MTVTSFREALEDGECLATFGIDDETAVDDAHDFLEMLERQEGAAEVA